MSLAEKFKGKQLESASAAQTLNFLKEIAKPVLQGKKERQVLAANVLEEGRKGPLGADQKPIEAIATVQGWRRVPDSGWDSALKLFGKHYDCSLIANGEIEASTKKGRLRHEIRLSTARRDIDMLRVEEYDPKTGGLVLVGFEIAKRKD